MLFFRISFNYLWLSSSLKLSSVQWEQFYYRDMKLHLHFSIIVVNMFEKLPCHNQKKQCSRFKILHLSQIEIFNILSVFYSLRSNTQPREIGDSESGGRYQWERGYCTYHVRWRGGKAVWWWFRRIRCGCNMQDAGIYVSFYSGLLVWKQSFPAPRWKGRK